MDKPKEEPKPETKTTTAGASAAKPPETKKEEPKPAAPAPAKPSTGLPEKKPENPIELGTATLTGDLRDAILQVVRGLKKPWEQMSEMEQRGLVDNVSQRADHLVGRCVKLIAAQGRKTLAGQLESVTIKDEVKAVVTFSKMDEQIMDVYESQGMAVLFVVSDKEAFTGEKAPAKVIPDQKKLALPDDKDDKPVADKGKNIPQAKDREEKKADPVPGKVPPPSNPNVKFETKETKEKKAS